MHYNFNLKIPANTAKADQLELVCPLTYGILRKVSIYFRAGCADLTHIKIYRNVRQIYPTNPDLDYAFDDYRVDFETFFPIFDKPYEISIFGWNLDDTYEHMITCLFNVIHPKTSEIPEVETLSEIEALKLIGNYDFKEVI